MHCSMPGFPVLHYLLKFAQTHINWIGDAIQPSHPLSPPSSSAINLSQPQGLCQWVSSSQQVAKVLELQLQHQSFQWIFRVDFLCDWLVWSPCSPRDSQESSPAQFKSINSSALSLLYGPPLTSIHDYWKNHSFVGPCWQSGPLPTKCCLCFSIYYLGLSGLSLQGAGTKPGPPAVAAQSPNHWTSRGFPELEFLKIVFIFYLLIYLIWETQTPTTQERKALECFLYPKTHFLPSTTRDSPLKSLSEYTHVS